MQYPRATPRCWDPRPFPGDTGSPKYSRLARKFDSYTFAKKRAAGRLPEDQMCLRANAGATRQTDDEENPRSALRPIGEERNQPLLRAPDKLERPSRQPVSGILSISPTSVDPRPTASTVLRSRRRSMDVGHVHILPWGRPSG